MLFIVFISLFFTHLQHWLGIVCLCDCECLCKFWERIKFSQKRKVFRKLLRSLEWKKKVVKISCSDKGFLFFFSLYFALTQRNRDCVGFFTLSYRKMLTFTVRLLLVCLSFMCVCVCFACLQLLQKRELFQYKFKVMMFQASKPKSCFVYFFLKRVLSV